MKIAIMGAGGVGGYYGGLLAQAGHEVTFIARGAHLQAIRAHGLRIQSVHGDLTIAPARATDTPAEVGPVDLVLVCVKTTDTEPAAYALRPMLKPEKPYTGAAFGTAVLSLQNGIDAVERIGAIAGREVMLAGATWISAVIEAPGVIRQMSHFRRIVVGEPDGRRTPRVQAVYQALQSTGATVELSDNIRQVLWTKFVFIASLSGIGALTRLPVGDYRAVPETRALLTGLMREIVAVAQAEGVALAPDVVEQTLAFVDEASPALKPSMQRDVEAGRHSELESMIGVIVRRGRALGVPTPIAAMVYAALLPGAAMAQN